MRYKEKAFFVYQSDNFNLSNLTGLAPTATFNFNTQGDSDFFWEKFAVLGLAPDPSTIPQATTRDNDFVVGVTMTLTNITTGRALSNNPVPLPNIDGYLQFQPEPMVWPKKSTIQVTLSNESVFQSGSGAYAIISLSFMGTKGFF